MPVEIRYFPRSWIQIKSRGFVIYIDPSFMKSYYRKFKETVKFPSFKNDDAELPDNLEKADVILYTHAHKDHCKKITADLLRKDSTVFIGPKPCNKEIPYMTDILGLNQELEISGFKIKTVPAYNTSDGTSTRKVHNMKNSLGYIIEFENLRIYHAGDTDFIPEMKTLGDIDITFLPIGGTFTMDIDEVIEAAKVINPRILIPIHKLDKDPEQLRGGLKDTTITVQVLEIGETIVVGEKIWQRGVSN